MPNCTLTKIRKRMDWSPAIIPGESFKILSSCNKIIESLETQKEDEVFCEIHIRNYHENLEFRNPEFYIHPEEINTIETTVITKLSTSNNHKMQYMLPPMEINPGFAEICKFWSDRKNFNNETSTRGVLIYDINHIVKNELTNEQIRVESDGSKLMLMWSVHSESVNVQAVGIRAWDNVTANKDLFEEMCYRPEKGFRRKHFGCRAQYEGIVCNLPVKVCAMLSGDPRAVWGIDIE